MLDALAGRLTHARARVPANVRAAPRALGRQVFRGQNSSHTNIVFEDTTAVAIFDDGAHEKNASRRFKVWGNLAAEMISKHTHRTGAAPL